MSRCGVFVPILLQKKSNKYYIFWVRVCSLRYLVCSTHVPYRHLWPVRLYYIRPHYLIRGTIFGERVIEPKMCILILAKSFFFIFLIRWRIERNSSKTYVGHVKYPLFVSDFNKTWIFWTYFSEKITYQILWKSFKWEPPCSMRTDGQTWPS